MNLHCHNPNDNNNNNNQNHNNNNNKTTLMGCDTIEINLVHSWSWKSLNIFYILKKTSNIQIPFHLLKEGGRPR